MIARVFIMGVVMVVSVFANQTPIAWNKDQKVIIEYYEKLFASSKDVNHAEIAKKLKARREIEEVMDWDRVKVDCLGKENIAKRTAAEANEFRNLLKDVIVRTAYTRLDKFWEGLTYKFSEITIKDASKEAFVKAIFTVTKDASKSDFSLDYYMTKKNGKWFIYDIAYEDLRYSENIAEQIIAFLREKPFKDLINKLKKRRDDLAKN